MTEHGNYETEHEHPQAQVVIDGEPVLVDEELTELITLMNEAGIYTIMSCQDNSAARGDVRRIWVSIYADDLASFVDILDQPSELHEYDSLSNRMAPEFEPEYDWQDFRENRAWHYDIAIGRINGEVLEADVSIRFPYTDLAEVCARLRRLPGITEARAVTAVPPAEEWEWPGPA